VIPECSEKDADGVLSQPDTGGGWIGATPRKGLGVFTYGGVRGVVLEQVDDSIHYMLPLAIQAPLSVRLLAVWAYRGRYRPRVRTYSDHLSVMSAVYAPFLAEAPSICVGDFNSNAIWDRPKSQPHAELVRAFEGLGLQSVYHSLRGEAQGNETEATFYFWRQRARAFHIDHCFVSSSLLGGCSLAIGTPDEWLSLSDHMPLVLEVVLPATNTSSL